MKKLLFATLMSAVTLFSSNSASAQEVGANGPAIEFKKDTHDYGDVKYGADGTCKFEFKNTGNAPLVISSAKGSCGCTVPEWPQEPILPGKTGVITVKYDTKRSGVINKSVTITSNATNDPTKIIRIKGNVGAKPEGTTSAN